MRQKLTGNGLWESSRMILPEHRKRMNNDDHERNRRVKPILAEEERNNIDAAVAISYKHKMEVTFTIFDPFEDKELTGIVERIDRQLRRFRVGEYEWVKFGDVLKVRVEDYD